MSSDFDTAVPAFTFTGFAEITGRVALHEIADPFNGSVGRGIGRQRFSGRAHSGTDGEKTSSAGHPRVSSWQPGCEACHLPLMDSQ
jgi:hypothetical protein